MVTGADSCSTSVGPARCALGKAMMLSPWRDRDAASAKSGVAADAADRLPGDPLDVHLPDRIHLECGVDGDEAVVRGEATDVMGDLDRLEQVAAVAPVVERLRSREVGAAR